MATMNLTPTLEHGEWICPCGNKIKDSIATDTGSESPLISALFTKGKKCSECGQPMYFEPYLKGGPPRDIISDKHMEA